MYLDSRIQKINRESVRKLRLRYGDIIEIEAGRCDGSITYSCYFLRAFIEGIGYSTHKSRKYEQLKDRLGHDRTELYELIRNIRKASSRKPKPRGISRELRSRGIKLE